MIIQDSALRRHKEQEEMRIVFDAIRLLYDIRYSERILELCRTGK